MDPLATTLTVLDYAAVAVFAASGALAAAGVIGFASAFMVRAGAILFGWQMPGFRGWPEFKLQMSSRFW